MLVAAGLAFVVVVVGLSFTVVVTGLGAVVAELGLPVSKLIVPETFGACTEFPFPKSTLFVTAGLGAWVATAPLAGLKLTEAMTVVGSWMELVLVAPDPAVAEGRSLKLITPGTMNSERVAVREAVSTLIEGMLVFGVPSLFKPRSMESP